MAEMTTEQYQEALATLRTAIAEAINAFETATGAEIENINLRAVEIPPANGGPKQYRRGVEVLVRPKLQEVVG